MSSLTIKGTGAVLLVDDDPTFQEIMAFAFENASIENEFIAVSSGEECIAYLNARDNDKDKFPSLILMDLHMPQMDGFATIFSIRNDPKYNEIEITALVSMTDLGDDAKKAIDAGANAICEKPFDITSLKIKRID